MLIKRQLSVVDRIVDVDFEGYVLVISALDGQPNIASRLDEVLTEGHVQAIWWRTNRSPVWPQFGTCH